MKYLGIFLVAILLAGCESPFAGKKGFKLTDINAPFRMKIVSISGNNYFGIINTNANFDASAGSLHFYAISAPASADAPALNTDLSLKIPSGAGDFAIENDVLFIADRTTNKILIYDLVGGSFLPRREANGEAKGILVGENPQKLMVFTSAGTGNPKVLAVVCQSAGIIHFIRLDTLEFISEGTETPASRDTITVRNIVGANLYMVPRQVETANRDDRIHLPSGVPGGYGINGITLLPTSGTKQIFVLASYFGTALFGYRFESLTNTSNIVWDLESARRATKEDGFRGLASDQSGNVFASSRVDSKIYKIPRAEFDYDKVAGTNPERNTRGFPQDADRFKLLQIEDAVFPALGDLVTNCPQSVGPIVPSCTDATFLWTFGLNSKKVYKIDISGVTITEESDAFGTSPQAILWHPTDNLLYVAQPLANRVTILNADTLQVVGQLQNP